MAVFKCKMCGGALEVEQGQTVATCEYCGTQQTLPKLDDDRRANLYDRANHFRRNNEFDKAMGIYEQILTEDNTDAEAYWSLVLCRYGIEYVEDPATRKRIPTVNRAQFTSVFDDDNYKSALEYGDGYQRHIYEEEAKAINEIQKGILAISQKEEPFDVFICYKETDQNGRRTPDSVLANDLYHQLTQEGFKVFFSRITLEDKLGTAYEPYIFAALNSAKVMVVLGTKPEYFNAVWVKNEWSRYLGLIKQGAKKMLIPAYKDMDPYDLPEEFSHLQAQDMSKLGFMQDLIRGIKKVVELDEPQATVVKETVVTGGNGNAESLLERAFMFLEDKDWTSTDEYCEKVLDLNPKNAEAYLGKLLAELKLQKKEDLKDYEQFFSDRNNYQKALRFADEELKADLIEFAKKSDAIRKDEILAKANFILGGDFLANYENALKLFESISGWKDADAKANECKRKIALQKIKTEEKQKELKARAKARKKFAMIAAMIAIPLVIVIVIVIVLYNSVIGPRIELNSKYKEAVATMDAGEYSQAISLFENLDGYKDSEDKIEECNDLIEIYNNLMENEAYNEAISLMNSGKFVEAYESFVALDGFKDSTEKAKSIYDEYDLEMIKSAKAGDYIFFGSYEQDDDSSNGKEPIVWLVLEVKDGKALVISRYALDAIVYNHSYNNILDTDDVTWETCSLREWLNNDFINKAFSIDEMAMIPTVTVSADKNPNYSTDPGNATQDQVFVLSITEVNRYFSSDSARKCEKTDYAVDAACNSDGICWWWLRTPGYAQRVVAYVDDFGDIQYEDPDDCDIAVRPAMWIDLTE